MRLRWRSALADRLGESQWMMKVNGEYRCCRGKHGDGELESLTFLTRAILQTTRLLFKIPQISPYHRK